MFFHVSYLENRPLFRSQAEREREMGKEGGRERERGEMVRVRVSCFVCESARAFFV
jgi:hypothetical protein